MSNSAFISENVDQELSLADLQTANGGFFFLLVSALLPGVANAPAPCDDTYTKPGLREVVTLVQHLATLKVKLLGVSRMVVELTTDQCLSVGKPRHEQGF